MRNMKLLKKIFKSLDGSPSNSLATTTQNKKVHKNVQTVEKDFFQCSTKFK